MSVGVGELPEAVDDVVLVGDLEVGRRWAGCCSAGVSPGVSKMRFSAVNVGVGVEHVDLLAVGAGGLEEGEAVGLVLGEGLLVAIDDLVGVVVELAEGDEAAALADFVCAGDGVGLRVDVEGGLGLFFQDAFGAPVVEGRGGAGVDVGPASVSAGRCLPRMTRMRL